MLTGHSLGAAYTTLLAMALLQQGERELTVVTFGSPRVGNAQFVTFYEELLHKSNSLNWRLTHFADPVPHLPLEAMHFRHASNEVHYDELNRHYRVCNGSGEDPACADGITVPLLLTDHWTYLGINFMKEFVGCKLTSDER